METLLLPQYAESRLAHWRELRKPLKSKCEKTIPLEKPKHYEEWRKRTAEESARVFQFFDNAIKRNIEKADKESAKKERDRDKRHALERARGIQHIIVRDIPAEGFVCCTNGHPINIQHLRKNSFGSVRGSGDIIGGHCWQCGKLPTGEWKRPIIYQPRPEPECPVYADVDWTAEEPQPYCKIAGVGSTELDVDWTSGTCIQQPPVPLEHINDPGIPLWTWVDIDGQKVKMPWSLVRAGDKLWNQDFTASNIVQKIEDVEEKFDNPGEPCEWYIVNEDVIFFRNQSVILVEGLWHAYHLKEGSVFGSGLEVETLRVIKGAFNWRRVVLDGDKTYYLNGYSVHNADRYAVATGNYNDNNTWSGTDGGAAPASFPTASDNAKLTALSGAITVTVPNSQQCLDLDCTGFTGTLTVSAGDQLGVNGHFTLGSGMTIGAGSSWRLLGTAKNITSAGKTTLSLNISSGSYTLQDNLVVGGTLQLSGVSLNTNNKTVNGAFLGSGATLTLGTTVWTCLVNNDWNATNLTSLSAASSTIICNSQNFKGGTHTYGTVTSNGNSAKLTAFTGAFTVATLTLTNTAAATYNQFTFAANVTVTGTFTVTGNNATTQKLEVLSSVQGTARTITAAVCSLTNVDFEDTVGAGAGTWSGTLLGDGGNNSGITFPSPISCFWVHAGAASRPFTDALWFTTSGGAVAARFPLLQDNAFFDGGSFSTTGRTVTTGTTEGIRFGSINWTGATNSPAFTFTAGIAPYGSVTLIVGMTLSGTFTLYLSGRGSHTLTSANNTWTNNIYFLGFGGTYTLQDSLAMSFAGMTLHLVYGTFTTNNFNVNCMGFTSSVTSIRTLNLGSSIFTCNQVSGWDTGTATNLTLNAGTSTIVFTSTGTSTISMGNGPALTYNNITISNIASGYTLLGSAANIINGTLTVLAGIQSLTLASSPALTVRNIVFTAGYTGNWVMNNALSISGNLTTVAGMTTTGTSLVTFTATAGQSITTGGISYSFPVTFAGVNGLWTLQDAFTTTQVFTLTTGSISSAFNVTALSASAAAGTSWTQTANTILLTTSGTVWSASATATVVFTGSTIKLTDATATAKTFAGGGKTYGNIWLSGAGSGTFDFTGSNTFNNFKADSGRSFRMTAGTTTTVATMTTSGATMGAITAANFNWVITGGPTYGLGSMTISRTQASPDLTFYAGATSTNGGNNNQVYFADAPVSKTQASPWESLAFINKTQQSPWEAAGNLAKSVASPYESQGFLQQTKATPWESIQALTKSSDTVFESSGFAMNSGATPWESRGFIPEVLRTTRTFFIAEDKITEFIFMSQQSELSSVDATTSKYLPESYRIAWDFSNRLETGESLTLASGVSVTDVSGNDVTSQLIDALTVDAIGPQLSVTLKANGGAVGRRYYIQFSAITTLAQTIIAVLELEITGR